MRQVVRTRSSLYDLTRTTSTVSDGGATRESTTTITDVQMWIMDPRETAVELAFGEPTEGDLTGFAVPSADVQVHDDVTVDGTDYEIDTVTHLPSNDNPEVKRLSLIRKR